MHGNSELQRTFRHLYVPMKTQPMAVYQCIYYYYYMLFHISPTLKSIMPECAVPESCHSPSAALFYFILTFIPVSMIPELF